MVGLLVSSMGVAMACNGVAADGIGNLHGNGVGFGAERLDGEREFLTGNVSLPEASKKERRSLPVRWRSSSLTMAMVNSCARAGLKGWMPEIQIHAEGIECLLHRFFEVRFQLQLLEIHESDRT